MEAEGMETPCIASSAAKNKTEKKRAKTPAEDAKMTPSIPRVNAWTGIGTWTVPVNAFLRRPPPLPPPHTRSRSSSIACKAAVLRVKSG